MEIFLAFTGNKVVKEFMERYNCGWLFNPTNFCRNEIIKKKFILDNGRFGIWIHNQRNPDNKKEWDEEAYFKYLKKFNAKGPVFNIVPDLPAEGITSLIHSEEYVDQIPRPRYLAVQDNMLANDVRLCLDNYDGIFVGGTVPWKMETAKMWSDIAHLHGIKCHVGRIGTFQGYSLCRAWGVDSVDGSNPSRNCDERPLRMFKEQATFEAFGSFDWMDVNEPDFRYQNLSESV